MHDIERRPARTAADTRRAVEIAQEIRELLRKQPGKEIVVRYAIDGPRFEVRDKVVTPAERLAGMQRRAQRW